MFHFIFAQFSDVNTERKEKISVKELQEMSLQLQHSWYNQVSFVSFEVFPNRDFMGFVLICLILSQAEIFGAGQQLLLS